MSWSPRSCPQPSNHGSSPLQTRTLPLAITTPTINNNCTNSSSKLANRRSNQAACSLIPPWVCPASTLWQGTMSRVHSSYTQVALRANPRAYFIPTGVSRLKWIRCVQPGSGALKTPSCTLCRCITSMALLMPSIALSTLEPGWNSYPSSHLWLSGTASWRVASACSWACLPCMLSCSLPMTPCRQHSRKQQPKQPPRCASLFQAPAPALCPSCNAGSSSQESTFWKGMA
mmetsp:Transcript_19686/g.54953  ORF Transcript_19686/g.54953 Transcript_19686/m.54953 type:complete len:230 (+) Transcript_19686:525-1214(+)